MTALPSHITDGLHDTVHTCHVDGPHHLGARDVAESHLERAEEVLFEERRQAGSAIVAIIGRIVAWHLKY